MNFAVTIVRVEFADPPAVILTMVGLKLAVGACVPVGVKVAESCALAVKPVLAKTTRVVPEEPAIIVTWIGVIDTEKSPVTIKLNDNVWTRDAFEAVNSIV